MNQNYQAPDACVMEMDPELYIHNVKELRKRTGDKVKLCAVMKADAYAHGIETMIDPVVRSGVEYLSAIDNCEFRIMFNWFKEHNVQNVRMLRLAPATKEELIESQIHGWDVEEIAGALEQAQYFSNVASELSKQLGREVIVKVHINVETGMGRMGVRSVDDMKKILLIPNLKVVGIMTHLAREYESPPNDSIATKAQVDLFESSISQLNLGPDVIRHVANSAAIVKKQYTHFDMVRVGSLGYGEDKDEIQDPENVLLPIFHKWRTSVVIVLKNVPPNTPIGYNGIEKTRSDKESTTATIRVGYDYGFPQYGCLNKHFVLIRGKRFPIIGKTSMNMLVIDITDQEVDNQVQIGDEVVIIGKQGKEYISWDEFSSKQKKGITEQYIEIGNQCPKIIVKLQ